MAIGDKQVNLNDLKTVYDKQNGNIAPTEASSTASAAHKAGSYFIYNGMLYQATADIASGGTITPNTNCKEAPLGGEISGLTGAFNQFSPRPLLPAGYRAVESVESSGTQAILAHGGSTHYLTGNSRVVITFAQTAAGVSRTNYLFGCRKSSSTKAFYVTIGSDGTVYRGYGASDAEINTGATINDTDIHTIDCNKNLTYLDGTLIHTAPAWTGETVNYNSRVFGIRSTGGSPSLLCGYYRIYQYTEYDNGVMVADLYPCVRESDNTSGMYNVIDGTFCSFDSDSSGALTANEYTTLDEIDTEIVKVPGIESNVGRLNDLTNDLHYLINYNYDTPYARNPGTTDDSGKLGIVRNGPYVTLNGTLNYTSNDATLCRLNGTVATTILSSTAKGWNANALPLVAGRAYRAIVRRISGTATSLPTVSIYRFGEASTVGRGYRESADIYKADFTAESGVSYNLVLYCSKGNTYTDAKLLVTVEDITAAEIDRSYVLDEAARVAAKVRSVQTGNSLTFAAVSDLHYPVLVGSGDGVTVGNAQTALRDMRDGIKAIAEQTHIDFYACFGDVIYQWQGHGANYDNGVKEMIGVTKLLNDAFGNNLQVRMVGNHDPNCENSDSKEFSAYELNAFTGIYSDMLKKNESLPYKGYGYHDFERQKIRMIVLNTSQYSQGTDLTNGQTKYSFGSAQAHYMCQAMDLVDGLDSKTDPENWQIMICSHVAIDNSGQHDICKFTNVINAYLSGGSWSGDSYSYNFSGKNAAKLALYINGHSHCYWFKNLAYRNASGVLQGITPVANLYIPNALPGREEFSLLSEAEGGTKYAKTTGSAESTAFQVITIDPSAKIVYAHHYGAGIDIIMHYDSQAVAEETELTTDLTSPTWYSKSTDYATVSDGTVTPVASGNTMIWCKSDDDNCCEVWNIAVSVT